MSNKKRQKRYHGPEAKQEKIIHRKFSVDPDRPHWQEWLEENKRRVIVRVIQVSLLAVTILILMWVL